MPAAVGLADERAFGHGSREELASDEVYYRTKAAAVLWMLRSIVGDAALGQALQSYRYMLWR